MKGTLGGYVAETERRLVYPVAGLVVEHELLLKPENIFIEKEREGFPHQICILASCADTTNLVDTCDIERDRLACTRLCTVKGMT
jgi:hypothetical protein